MSDRDQRIIHLQMNAAEITWADDEHVWHPFTPMTAHRVEHPPIIERAEGFWLYDTTSQKYLDGISSLWCNVHGHHVPEIDEAIRQQLDQVAHSTLLGLGNVPSVKLAQKLVNLAPSGLNKVFYSDNGSTAVEAALKIAYQYHRQKPCPEERALFVTISQAYHGDTLGSVSVGAMELFHQVYGKLLFKTIQLPSPVAYRFPDGFKRESYLEWTFMEATRIITEHASEIAAVIMEPIVQGAAGILVHPRGYLKHIREITSSLGIPLICDEVAVGFGRTGTMFACEQEQVIPDMLCLAKGLTGGYLPLAATLAQNYIYEAFLGEPKLGRTFFHGHTFTGNPLGCAAALANLELFAACDLLKHVKEMTTHLTTRLSILDNHPYVGEVRQQGMMVGIELVADKKSKTSFDPSLRLGHQVTLEARKNGVIIRPLGDVIVLMPALAMPVKLIDQLCDVTFKSIDEVIIKQITKHG